MKVEHVMDALAASATKGGDATSTYEALRMKALAFIQEYAALAQGQHAAHTPTLVEVRQKIAALPKWDKRSVPGGFHINRADTLAIIDEAVEGDGG